MKTLLGIVFFLFHASFICAYPPVLWPERTTKEEQEKLINTLNDDRKMIKLNETMQIMTYSEKLETRASKTTCKYLNDLRLLGDRGIVYLKMDEIASKFNGTLKRNDEMLFNPKATKVGCSKSVTCTLEPNFNDPRELRGKTGVVNGICVIDVFIGALFNLMEVAVDKKSVEEYKDLDGLKLPPVSKYGDILGVKQPETPKINEAPANSTQDASENSSDRIFSMTLFSLILVFYV